MRCDEVMRELSLPVDEQIIGRWRTIWPGVRLVRGGAEHADHVRSVVGCNSTGQPSPRVLGSALVVSRDPA